MVIFNNRNSVTKIENAPDKPRATQGVRLPCLMRVRELAFLSCQLCFSRAQSCRSTEGKDHSRPLNHRQAFAKGDPCTDDDGRRFCHRQRTCDFRLQLLERNDVRDDVEKTARTSVEHERDDVRDVPHFCDEGEAAREDRRHHTDDHHQHRDPEALVVRVDILACAENLESCTHEKRRHCAPEEAVKIKGCLPRVERDEHAHEQYRQAPRHPKIDHLTAPPFREDIDDGCGGEDDDRGVGSPHTNAVVQAEVRRSEQEREQEHIPRRECDAAREERGDKDDAHATPYHHQLSRGEGFEDIDERQRDSRRHRNADCGNDASQRSVELHDASKAGRGKEHAYRYGKRRNRLPPHYIFFNTNISSHHLSFHYNMGNGHRENLSKFTWLIRAI